MVADRRFHELELLGQLLLRRAATVQQEQCDLERNALPQQTHGPLVLFTVGAAARGEKATVDTVLLAADKFLFCQAVEMIVCQLLAYTNFPRQLSQMHAREDLDGPKKGVTHVEGWRRQGLFPRQEGGRDHQENRAEVAHGIDQLEDLVPDRTGTDAVRDEEALQAEQGEGPRQEGHRGVSVGAKRSKTQQQECQTDDSTEDAETGTHGLDADHRRAPRGCP